MAQQEIIYAKGDGSDYIHGELYETSFEGLHHIHTIFTKKIWDGFVKITIEAVDEDATEDEK